MHKQLPFYLYIICVMLCVLLQSNRCVYACSTPVFRYAISKWPPDTYYATVIHDGPLSKEGEKAISLLRGIGNRDHTLNLKIDVKNIAGPQIITYEDILSELGEDKLPAILLFYPHKKEASVASFWHGPLNSESVNLILDSPIRRQVVKQLVAGDVATWVMIKSGDKTKDSQTIKNLTDNLLILQKEMRKKDKLDAIPFLNGDDAFSFSIIPVSRKNKAESVLLAMILNMDPKTKHDSSVPVAFPVFGQGRTLTGHKRETLDKESVGKVCTFLCGECSCMIKAQNPGLDMMLAADWSKALKNIPEEDKAPPVLTGINLGETSKESKDATTDAPNDRRRMSFAQIIVLTLAGIGGVTFAISGYIYFRK
ncbi:MAG: hypothetical protein KAH23_06720 [Kiritimatiellae bacterium]|nr:hypothetical protein [Kiritimatiellia bacterium]